MPLLVLLFTSLASAATDNRCQAILTNRAPTNDEFVWRMAKEPSKAYTELESQFEDASLDAAGGKGFSYRQIKPVVMQILEDIGSRLDKDSILELDQFSKYHARLNSLKKKMVDLLHQNLPYTATCLAIIEWSRTMDDLFRSVDPVLKGTYHREIAGPELMHLLDPSHHTYVYFSFESVDDDYFLLNRAAPIYLLGLLKAPAFKYNKFTYQGGPLVDSGAIYMHIDGYLLDLYEFLCHDAGHSAFMQRRDIWLFANNGLTRQQSVQEWETNSRSLYWAVSALIAKDNDLGRAAKLIMSEVIHERGYQYELSILKQQLSTSKWVDVIRKKIQNNYWNDVRITNAQSLRLAEARQWLLNYVENMILHQNIARIGQYEAIDRPIVIKKWLPIRTFRGRPTGVQVRSLEDFQRGLPRVMIHFDLGSEVVETSLYEVSLAQIRVGQPVLSDPAVLNHLVQLKSSSEPERLSNTEIFKLEQIYTLMARKNSSLEDNTEFTITSEPEIFEGRIVGINLLSKTIVIQSAHGQLRTERIADLSLEKAPTGL